MSATTLKKIDPRTDLGRKYNYGKAGANAVRAKLGWHNIGTTRELLHPSFDDPDLNFPELHDHTTALRLVR